MLAPVTRGLANLPVEAGFGEGGIVARQRGNRCAAPRNMEDRWPPHYGAPTDPPDNDPGMPVWARAFARKA